MEQFSYSHEKQTNDKYLKRPIMHSNIPTISASNMASSVYNSSEESTMRPKTFETRRETNATGPIASWRDDPNIAYTNIGTKPVSGMGAEKESELWLSWKSIRNV